MHINVRACHTHHAATVGLRFHPKRKASSELEMTTLLIKTRRNN